MSLHSLRLMDSPTPLVESLANGMKVIPPAAIWKHTEFPYSEATTTAELTAAISSGVNSRVALTAVSYTHLTLPTKA